MLDAWLDLIHGGGCVGCGTPGRPLCRACAATLPTRGRVVRPTPCPAGLATCVAAGEYADLLRAMVLAHKEHGVFALAAPLGRVLAVRRAAAVLGEGLARARAGALASRAWSASAGTTRCCGSPGRPPVGCGSRVAGSGSGGCSRCAVPVLDQAGLDAGAARRQPVRVDGRAPPAATAPGSRGGAGVDRGLRRRAHDRRHGPRGAARARGRAGFRCAPWRPSRPRAGGCRPDMHHLVRAYRFPDMRD